MSQQDRTTLKGYFESNDVPNQSQFEDLIDSYLNKTDESDQIVPAPTSGDARKIPRIKSDESGLENVWQNVEAVNPKNFNAKGDGATDDSDAIQNAIDQAGDYGMVYFPPSSTEYILDGEIAAKTGQTWLGYGATLKRADARKTESTAQVDSGDTTIPVNDASIFDVGEDILISDTTRPEGGAGAFESSIGRSGTQAPTITDIDTQNNIITVDQGIKYFDSDGNEITDSYPSGSPVFAVFDMVNANNDRDFSLIGLTLDGNESNNTYTYYNRVNRGVLIQEEACDIINCTFNHMRTDNIVIYGGGGTIRGNKAKNLYGSFVHLVSPVDPNNIPSHKILFNHIENACQATNAQNFHNEAVFTYSFGIRDVKISHNYVDGSGRGCFGYVAGDESAGNEDTRGIVTNNIFKNADEIAQISGANATVEDYIIEGNLFLNCGDFYTNGSGLKEGFGTNKIIFKNNIVTNGRLKFLVLGRGKINDNIFLVKDSFGGFSSAITGNAQVTLAGFNIDFHGNYVIGPETIDTNMKHGVCFYVDSNRVLKDSSGNDTDYYYLQNVSAIGNTVIGHEHCIFSGDQLRTARDKGVVNWQYKNNSVIPNKSSTNGAGIICEPGTVCENNSVYVSSNSDGGIIVPGVSSNTAEDGSTPINDILTGGIVRFNTIYGDADYGIDIDGYNNLVKYNVVSGTYNGGQQGSIVGIRDTSSGNSTESNNDQMSPNAVYPEIIRFQQDSGQY